MQVLEVPFVVIVDNSVYIFSLQNTCTCINIRAHLFAA